MIFDKIENRSFYGADPDLGRILDFLGSFQSEDYPKDRVVLDGDHLYINPVQLVTRPESECLFEAHRHYADVHFIVEGREKIVVQDSGCLQVTEPYSQEKDCLFGTSEEGMAFILRPGDFLVCYPQDAHKVAVAPGEPGPVKKLVGKIKVR